VKGVVFGKLTMEVGDKTEIVCSKTGYSCEIEFKMKGMIFGKDQENMVTATVKHNGAKVHVVHGYWDDVLDLLPADSKKKEGAVFLDVTVQKKDPIVARDPAEMEEFESRKLWADVTAALLIDNQEAATAAKTKLEDRQRAEAKERKEKGEQWVPKYFAIADEEDEKSWRFKNINLEKYTPGEPYKSLDGREPF
jgi:hypothetical protein